MFKKVFHFLKKDSRPQTQHPYQVASWHVLGDAIVSPRRYDSFVKEGYQKNGIVYRCVSLISRSVGSVPWLLYENDDRHEIHHHSLLSLLNYPNHEQAGSAFMESVVGYFLLSGNAYIEKILDDKGHPIALYALRPDRITIMVDEDGNVTGYKYRYGKKERFIPKGMDAASSPILHLRNFHPFNDWYGMSPVEAACTAIDQHNTVSSHNLSILQNGGRPSGALLFKGKFPGLSDAQRESLKQDLKDAYEGNKNAGRILMLEGDFEWKEMGLSPKDLDFIEGKNLSAREIAQTFGVPPMLAGIPGDATFANYKEARLNFWEDTILPLLEYLKEELNAWLTSNFGNKLALDYDHDAIPALAARREGVWEKIAQANFLTINEKRHAVGYGPLKGGDQLAPHVDITNNNQ